MAKPDLTLLATEAGSHDDRAAVKDFMINLSDRDTLSWIVSIAIIGGLTAREYFKSRAADAPANPPEDSFEEAGPSATERLLRLEKLTYLGRKCVVLEIDPYAETATIQVTSDAGSWVKLTGIDIAELLD